MNLGLRQWRPCGRPGPVYPHDQTVCTCNIGWIDSDEVFTVVGSDHRQMVYVLTRAGLIGSMFLFDVLERSSEINP